MYFSADPEENQEHRGSVLTLVGRVDHSFFVVAKIIFLLNLEISTLGTHSPSTITISFS